MRARKPGKIERAFGRALREAREKAVLSQEALALESGYHPTYISMLERGLYSPSVRTIFSLARVLKISPAVLMERAYNILNGN